MADIVSRKKRSEMMSGIRSRNTTPELVTRKALHKLGFRFRLHQSGLPGKPDLVFQKYKAVIFTHGCFWHSHKCHLFKWPSSRPSFWREKINGNRKKDKKSIEKLFSEKWRVLVIWECALKGKSKLKPKKLFSTASRWLKSKEKFLELHGRN